MFGITLYVSYWFPLVHDRLPVGGRAGLVATNTIRQNESREATLDYIVDNGGIIYNAVSTQPWSGDAAVYVSLVNWSKGVDVAPKILWLNDGKLRLTVDKIPTSLSPSFDVRTAAAFVVNEKPQVCFQGQTPGVTEAFVIGPEECAKLLNEQDNQDVIHLYLGGREMLRYTTVDRWIIDISEDDLVVAEHKYLSLMKRLRQTALPVRQEAALKEAQRNTKVIAANPLAKPNRHHEFFLNRWWQLGYRRKEMLDNISGLNRYIATSRVASINRLTIFAFVDSSIRPGDSMTVFAFSDDYSFGILSSSLHQAWLSARCSTLKGDPRYTSSTVFDSFPWPQSPDAKQVDAVGKISGEILELRDGYLNQGQSLGRQYDALRDPGKSALRDLHTDLNKAVYNAYGFQPDDDALAQLFALNQDIASEPEGVRGPGPGGLDGVRVTDYRVLPPPGWRS